MNEKNTGVIMELLSPAGDITKLQFAIEYGADAVYIGGQAFSLRQGARNFDPEQLAEAVDYAHKRGRKIYLTLNSFLHTDQWQDFEEYLRLLDPIPLDAYIIADLGAVATVRERYPHKDIHISTQANTTNARTVKFYEKMGVSRVVLARELSLREIRAIHDQTDIELEAFVHGAMCIAYSGRCLLSNYFTNAAPYAEDELQGVQKRKGTRDANQGDCSQSCRWEYDLIERQRPDEVMTIGEDTTGTYIMSSRDLNMARYIKELREAGISSFKIEGRVKSLYYVANITRVYRQAMDLSLEDSLPPEELLEELNAVSHRPYTTGFYFEHNRLESLSTTHDNKYIRPCKFLGYVIDDSDPKRPLIRAANQVRAEWDLEVITPSGANHKLNDFKIIKKGAEVPLVQTNDEFVLECDVELHKHDILRAWEEQIVAIKRKAEHL